MVLKRRKFLKMSVSREKYERLKMAIYEWNTKYKEEKEKNNILNQRIQELEKDLELSRDKEDQEIKTLKRAFNEAENKYKDRISHLERDKLLMEGKIQQLEDAKKDLHERYNDLKQDYRELSKK